MITTYSELLPMAMPELRNCPEPLVLQSLERAGRELCTLTTVWQKELGPISIVADQAEYPLDVGETVPDGDPQPEIRWIDWAKVNGAVIDASHYDLIQATAGVGVTADYALKYKEDYVPAADIEDGLTVNVVLVPNRASGYLAPILLDTYGDALVSGALWRLLRMPKKPWTDREQSREHYHDWASGVASALGESYTGRKTGSMCVNLDNRPWL